MGQEPMCYAAEIGGADVAVLLTGVGQRASEARRFRKSPGANPERSSTASPRVWPAALRPEYSIAQVLAAREIASEAVTR